MELGKFILLHEKGELDVVHALYHALQISISSPKGVHLQMINSDWKVLIQSTHTMVSMDLYKSRFLTLCLEVLNSLTSSVR